MSAEVRTKAYATGCVGVEMQALTVSVVHMYKFPSHYFPFKNVVGLQRVVAP